MTAGLGRFFAVTGLSGLLATSGCVYTGGNVDPLERPGPPLGMTVLRVPWEKCVIPPPPPGGFSSTYQKQVLERQRLARLQAARDGKGDAGAASAGEKTAAGDSPAAPQ